MAKIQDFFYEKIWNPIIKFILFIKDFFDKKVFSSYKSTILFTAALLGLVLFLIQMYIIIFNHSVYNNNSDDILQYYMMTEGFIRSIKDGTLTFFDLNNYFGASLFSNLYYVPLDPFTFITLILSFVMPTVVAVSFTEMIKIIAGVVLLGIYMSLKKYKTSTIFWVGLIYFVNGGSVSFMNFPAFLTMTVYLPLALIVIHYFFEKKCYVVPLYVVLIIFYNFYLAYMLLVFISFAYMIEYFKFNKFNFKKFLLNGMGFLSLLLVGVLMSSVVLLPAITFISEETVRSAVTFHPWVIDLKFTELKLFDIQVYIRYFAKLYAPQRPVSFRGFLGDYKLEHVSNYMTLIGLVFMLLVFFMKDKKARVYQIMFGLLFVFSIFPFFSSLFSGTFLMEMLGDGDVVAYPYNRWLNLVPILEVLVIAHVIETYKFNTFKRWQLWISGFVVIALGSYLVYYYGIHLADEEGFVLDSLTYDRRLMIVSLIILAVGMMVVLFKKYHLFKMLILAEVVVAVGYIFASGFGSHNRLVEFNTANEINKFIVENVDDDEFTRVYVDMYNLDHVEDYNFNQLTTYPTNTRIFHSWTDAETDYLSYLFGSFERQSKNNMNYYSYYLSSFLGYRYILTGSTDVSFVGTSNYELVAQNDDYVLYKMNNVDSFYVYDSYMTYEEFRTMKRTFGQISAERAFLKAVLIDEERYMNIYDFDNFILDYVSDDDIEYNTDQGSIRSWALLYYARTETRNMLSNPDLSATYYVYNDFNIDYQSGEITLRDNNYGIDNYGEVFYINENNEEVACSLEEDTGDRTVIHCGQFFNPIEEIYVERTDSFTSVPYYVKRLERAIEGRSYLVYDLSNNQDDFNNKVIQFDLGSYDLERNFIVDEAGNEINPIDDIYVSVQSPHRIYIYKSAEIYSAAKSGDLDLFSGLSLKFTAFDVVDNNLSVDFGIVENKNLTISQSRIHLSYDYLSASTKDNIVVIPVTYSDDWQFTTDDIYDKISVSGGFLGIVIPEGTEHVDIQLRFVPKALDTGLKLTLGGTLVFIGVILTPIVVNKFKRGVKNDESKTDSTSI